MKDLVGVIPAAGRGIRAYPHTEFLPKCLLEVDGVPLLRRNLELMRDQLGIRHVRIVIGHHGERIREYVGDGAGLGLRIELIENDRLDRELAYSIRLGVRGVDGPCLVMLSDECYVGSNHRDLLASARRESLVTCGLVRSETHRQVKRNYIAKIENGRVTDLIEKPEDGSAPWMGVGSYLLQPEATARLEAAYAGADETWPRDWTTWVGGLARAGEPIDVFHLAGQYVNVNDREALAQANHLLRNRDFDARTTSLVYVVDDAEDRVEEPVRAFAEAEELDEVLVAARRPSAALDAVRNHPKVRVLIHDDAALPLGHLTRAGLDAASGDILLMAYSDDSFALRDLAKLLIYVRDADLVVGTRTTRQMIEQGSNMRGLARAGNVAVAKLLEILWWRFDSRFTDLNCVYRAFWRSTWTLIRDELKSPGVEIFPEMIIEVLRARRRVIEIPVHYCVRNAELDYVPSKYQNLGTFFRLVWLLLRKRLQAPGASRVRRALPAQLESDA
ncbi:MAG: NTP transferase domain-containing protein [Deltaproteobacteria bacterium]|nr:NTP transferase domain-containing protein [Deltaproteobacteria bacterium]